MTFNKQQRAPHRRSLSHIRRTFEPPVPPTVFYGAQFNGTSDYIEWTGTASPSIGGALTIAIVTYLGSDSDDFGLWYEFSNGNTPRLATFRDIGTLIKQDNGTSSVFVNTSVAEGNWYELVYTKAAGSATPRLHYTADGTNWTHGDASGALGDSTASITRLSIGCERFDSVPFSKGLTNELATMAIWSADTNDAGCAALNDYNNWTAKASPVFFPGSSMLAGGTMIDTASSLSETGRSGVPTGVQPIPSWFLNFPAAAPSGNTLRGQRNRGSRPVPIIQKQQY